MRIDIKKNIIERFVAPLEANYQRRIIFWQDPDGEFSDLVDELCIDDVKILKLTGKNSFAAKMLLSEIDTESDYLVYNPISYSDISDNWLLDIELYSEEFRADLLSIRMQELGMPATSQMRKAMKSYSKFFDNKDRVAKLAAFKSNYSNVGQLHIDILAVLAGSSVNTASGVIRAILMSGLDAENNDAIMNIKKFGNEAVLWELINRYTGYTYDENTSLISLASHILLTTLSVTMKASCLNGLERFISEQHQQLCYSIINEWIHSDDDDELYDIACAVEEQHHLVKLFDGLDIEDLLNSECFPCINECILRRYMSEISDHIIKADDMIMAVEKRRTLKWYERVRNYYDGLLQVAKMQQFYQANITGFHIAEYDKLWKEYCSNYCKMDYYYRQFHTAFGKSLKESNTVLEDLYKSVADYVEKLYKNWYLANLGNKWTSLIADEMKNSSMLEKIPQQKNFYKYCVKPIVGSGSRAYVIISDALRYEVAEELGEQLMRETKGSVDISSMQAIFPSITKFGMAALLPNDKLQLSDDIYVLCDGKSTEGTANRGKILNKKHEGNVAITYKELLAMKQAERREIVNGAQVVYIYHNTIDAVGDKVSTEDQVFEACERAVLEIINLVRLITNDLSGTNILITADHGFLYSYKPLDESDKAEKNFITGQVAELDRRYVIADGSCSAEHMIRIPMTHVNSDLVGFTPLDNIRIKKQGGGMNYVHGGISLQEMMVPVITFKNMRTTSKKFVEASKVKLELLSSGRKVSNSVFSLNFYQKEAVGGKVGACVYSVFFTDAAGRPISDVKTIIADKTTDNGSDRVFRETFTLKSQEYKKTEEYYLNIVEKDSSDISERIAFYIDISFDISLADDFNLVFGEENKNIPVQAKAPAREVIFKDIIYTFDEAKELYLKVYPEENFNGSALNSKLKQELEKQGYLLDSSFAVKGFLNATEYFIAEFDKQDILDVTQYTERFGQTIVGSALKVLTDRSEIIKFEPNQFINVRKLNTLGIRKKQIREYCDQVFAFGQSNKYFTVRSLLSSGMKADIDNLGFGEIFYESLITEDSRFAKTTLGKTLIFSALTDKITAVEFIVDYVTRAGFIEVDTLLSDLNKKFGIELNRQGLFARIKDTALYFDKILDYLYKDYETYYQDI